MNKSYFDKQNNFEPVIDVSVHSNLGIAVVIPSYNEPTLYTSIQSLIKCERPKHAVEVIVVVNYPENSSAEVEQNANECIDIINKANEDENDSSFQIIPIKAFNLPKKHAGVGLARKTGMDQAAWRLLQSKSEHKIIACFDADSTCSANYLIELEKLWTKSPNTAACSIRYEHPLTGESFSPNIYQGIAQYELHLRYYVRAGQYIEHPFSYQTVGSSMACSAKDYLRFGGMNKNKAGEDFYFLQKIIPHGNFKLLNTAIVYPSPRPSYRVPFGTGRAMTKYVESDCSSYLTYNLDSFLPLKSFLKNASSLLFNASNEQVGELLKAQPTALKTYLEGVNFVNSVAEINANASNLNTFAKRFYLWFDAFKMLKYLNFANEHYYQKQPITAEAQKLATLLNHNKVPLSTKKLLLLYRAIDNAE